MREIRRKNPHVKSTEDMGTLDDVNEQEQAKDGAGAIEPFEAAQGREDVAQIKEDQCVNRDVAEQSAPLPLQLEKKEERVTVAQKQREARADDKPKREEKASAQKRDEPPKQAKRVRKGGALYVAFIAICILLSVAVVLYAAYAVPAETPNTEEAPQETTNASDAPEVSVTDTRSLYDRISDYAVTVRASTEDGIKISSGTVVFSEGYIAALWDDVGNASAIEIALKDGQTYAATLVGGSALSELALLKIDATLPDAFAVSEGVAVGDTVYAVGALGNSAYASLSSSLCKGSVSYGARNLRIEERETQKFIKTIQLDGFVGTSLGGCPVFDGNGDAVAIIVNVGESNARFALPIEEAISVLSYIKDNGKVSDEAVSVLASPCARLGVECESISGGVRIVAFDANDSDVAKKLKVGDVIVKIGDATVKDTQSLRSEIEKRSAGEKIEIFVQRYSQILSFYVELCV